MEQTLLTTEQGMWLDSRLNQPKGSYGRASGWVNRKEGEHGVLSSEPVPDTVKDDFFVNYPGAQVLHATSLDSSRTLFFFSHNSLLRLAVINASHRIKVLESSLPWIEGMKPQAVCKPDDRQEQVCYFTDGVHAPWYLNVDRDDIIRPLLAEQKKVDAHVKAVEASSELLSGRYYVFFRYSSRNQRTPYQYAGHVQLSDLTHPDGSLSRKQISLTLEGSSSWEYLEVAMHAYLGDTTETYRIARIKASQGQMTVSITGREERFTEALSELLLPAYNIASARTIAQKDGRLIMGNISYKPYDDLSGVASNIKLRWTPVSTTVSGSLLGNDFSLQVPDFSNVYMPSEIYTFAIRAHYRDGRIGNVYRIPSRPSTEERQLQPEGDYFRMPSLNELGSINQIGVEAYNISLTEAQKNTIDKIELLYSRDVGEVMACGYLFAVSGKLGVGLKETSIFTPVYPANARQYQLSNQNVAYDPDFDALGYSQEQNGKQAIHQKLFCFFSPDMQLNRQPLSPDRLRYLADVDTSDYTFIQKLAIDEQLNNFISQDIVRRTMAEASYNNLRVPQVHNLQEAIYIDSNSEVFSPYNFDFYEHDNPWKFNNRYQEGCVLLQTENKLPIDLDGSEDGTGIKVPYVQLLRTPSQPNDEHIRYHSAAVVDADTGIALLGGDVTASNFMFYRAYVPRDEEGRPNLNGHVASFNFLTHSNVNHYRKESGIFQERLSKFRALEDLDTYSDAVTSHSEALATDKQLIEFKPYNYWLLNESALQGSEIEDIRPDKTDTISSDPRGLSWSDASSGEDQYDGYLRFRPNNYINIPADKGDLTRLVVHNNMLLAHMQGGFYDLRMNPQQLESNEGVITVGTGNLFSLPPAEGNRSQHYYAGLSDVEHGSETPYGYFFVDSLTSRVYAITDTLTELSNQGMNSELESRDLKHCRLGFDPYYRRLIISNINGESLSYSMESKRWTCYHPYTASYYLHLPKETIRCSPNVMYRLSKPTQEYYPHNITFRFNERIQVEKVFHSLHAYTRGDFFNSIALRSERMSLATLDIIRHIYGMLNPGDAVKVRKIGSYEKLSLPGPVTNGSLRGKLRGSTLECTLSGEGNLLLHHIAINYRISKR